jgi:hypothetical protein
MQRRLMLAPTGKREGNKQPRYRVDRQEEEEHYSEERCRHRLFSIVPIVSLRVESGYVGRCLLCGASGPVRSHGEAARGALLDQIGREEGRRIAFNTE